MLYVRTTGDAKFRLDSIDHLDKCICILVTDGTILANYARKKACDMRQCVSCVDLNNILKQLLTQCNAVVIL